MRACNDIIATPPMVRGAYTAATMVQSISTATLR